MDESYFNSLETEQHSNIAKKEKVIRCCDIMENYMFGNSFTSCRECGQEINILNSNPEKYYEGSKNTSRVGFATNELLPDSTTGSVIAPNYTSNNSMRIISRLQVYQGIPYKTRSLLGVFNNISEHCQRHNISKKIINEAQGLYKLISQYKISRGNNRAGIIAASVFMSCKNCASPRSSAEIANIFSIEKKIITKGIKQLTDIIRVNKIPIKRVILDRVEAVDLIDRICNSITELNLSNINEIKILCNYYIENYQKDISSFTPPSLAAAVINTYIILNNIEIDKNVISKSSNVSVVTIQKITNILVILCN